MEKRTEKSTPTLFFLKCLLFSYIITALLLMLLALGLYRLNLGESVVTLAIILIYVVSTFLAGFVTGKKMQSRKYLWGLFMGCLYFGVLVVVSLAVNHTLGEIGQSFFTTLVLCGGGGMLGGMIS